MLGMSSPERSSSLPLPRPKSPPELYGKRRELAKVLMLEREIGFLQEEMKWVETLKPVSSCIKEVADYVVTAPEPLITAKTPKSCGFWRWLLCCSGNWCCNVSCVCCCCLELPDCCCSCSLPASDCCCSCSLPRCRCRCPALKPPSCPKCVCSKCCCWPTVKCSWPKLPKCSSCGCCSSHWFYCCQCLCCC